MVWTVELDPHVEKDLKRFDHQESKRILQFLFDRVAHLSDPRSIGEALKGTQFKNLWKYRVGDYRIISSIEDKSLKILVVKIGNRKDIYRQ
jgi:mRNA interferase RelE/StbE